MICPHCKLSRMFSERIPGIFESRDEWHCYACGEIIDSTILLNRNLLVPPRYKKKWIDRVGRLSKYSTHSK